MSPVHGADGLLGSVGMTGPERQAKDQFLPKNTPISTEATFSPSEFDEWVSMGVKQPPRPPPTAAVPPSEGPTMGRTITLG